MRRLTLRHDDVAETLTLDPPATVACDLAATLARWAQTGLQPLARGHFEKRITRLNVGGGHECRRRNQSASGPLSEHATGRALDVFSFVLEPEKDSGEREKDGREAGQADKAAATVAGGKAASASRTVKDAKASATTATTVISVERPVARNSSLS